jgi:hypothetical protein
MSRYHILYTLNFLEAPMRSMSIALATALVAVTAGTASAQQPSSVDLNTLLSGMTISSGGNGVVVLSSGGAQSASVPKVNEKPGAAIGLEGIALTGKQSEELAKLDSARTKAIADAKTKYTSEASRAGAVAAIDKQHTASVRAILTDAQLTKFDENMAAQKAKDDAANRAQSAQGGGQVIQFQMSGGGMGMGGGGMVIQATPTPAATPAPAPAPAATPDTTHK